MQFFAQFGLGDDVVANIFGKIYECKVVGVRFTEAKTFYDVQSAKTAPYYNVDSTNVHPLPGTPARRRTDTKHADTVPITI